MDEADGCIDESYGNAERLTERQTHDDASATVWRRSNFEFSAEILSPCLHVGESKPFFVIRRLG
jgi:hypothetical protein